MIYYKSRNLGSFNNMRIKNGLKTTDLMGETNLIVKSHVRGDKFMDNYLYFGAGTNGTSLHF